MKWLREVVNVVEGIKGPEVPVFEIEGRRPGKTLLVTGGMDGDEYAGIEAAYRLIGKYHESNFAGRLIVVPIVNLAGFDGECSWNPEDKRFPKYVFPGRANGTATERLMHWLSSNHVARADVWHDCHAGAITEGLRPFVWLYETGVADVDTFARALTEQMDAERFVFERAGMGSKAAQLARGGKAYILAESGERGERDEAAIARHVSWIETTMQLLGMIEADSTRTVSQPSIFKTVAYENAPFDGIWRPVQPVPEQVRRGDLLGTVLRLDGTSVRDLHASTDGTPLWWKETMRMKKGETLVAIGGKSV